jgi:hypothetical protein
MTTKNQRPEYVELTTTYLGRTCVRILGEHALGLPRHSPARAIITGLIRRWVQDGRPVGFDPTDDGYVLTREQAVAILRDTDEGGYVAQALTAHFRIEDEDVLGAEAVMAA